VLSVHRRAESGRVLDAARNSGAARVGRILSVSELPEKFELSEGGEGKRPGPRAPVPNAKIPLDVKHEDADAIVVVKPAGIAMHPGPQHGSDTLQNALVARFPELLELGGERGWGLVSRLDRHVSGLVVVARSAR
jgi:23S rRNA pseudouridine1911/1915/1917 synthase